MSSVFSKEERELILAIGREEDTANYLEHKIANANAKLQEYNQNIESWNTFIEDQQKLLQQNIDRLREIRKNLKKLLSVEDFVPIVNSKPSIVPEDHLGALESRSNVEKSNVKSKNKRNPRRR